MQPGLAIHFAYEGSYRFHGNGFGLSLRRGEIFEQGEALQIAAGREDYLDVPPFRRIERALRSSPEKMRIFGKVRLYLDRACTDVG